MLRDFVIIDQCLDAKRQQLMFTMLFIALFVEENRQMETKHSLVDAQNYRMPSEYDGKIFIDEKRQFECADFEFRH